MIEQIKRVGKRILAGMLCIMVMCSCIQFPTEASETETETPEVVGTAGSFYLSAATTDAVLIEPVEITYTAEQTTLRQVLEQLENYTFTFTGDFVGSIQGVDMGWSVFTNTGAYSMDTAPSEIQVLGFTTGNLGDEDTQITENGKALSELVKVMAQYNAMTGEIKNFPKAIEAYANAKQVLQTVAAEEAATAAQNLTQAIADYEAYVNGGFCTVTVVVSQGEVVLENPTINFIDVYGNTTVNEAGSSVDVKAGEYTYIISDGGYNRVEGSITVSEASTLQVELSNGNWFADIQIKRKKDTEKLCVSSEINAETHKAAFYIEDTVGPNDLYLYVEQGSVPESKTTKLRTCYTGTDGTDKSGKSHSWNSNSNILPMCLNTGMEGKEIKLEAYYDKTDYVQIQSYDLSIQRVPTLQKLIVREGSETGTSILSGFAFDITEYQVQTIADSVYIDATAFGEEGYTVTGAGQIALGEAESLDHTVTVSYAPTGETTEDVVEGQETVVLPSKTYTLHITKVDSVTVTFTMPQDTEKVTTLEVLNINGDIVTPVSDNTYQLIPEQTYTYIATKENYYHTTAEFTATTDLTVTVAEPDTTDALLDFALYDSSYVSSRERYAANETFTSDCHNYTYTVSDEYSMAAVQATGMEGYSITACYDKQSVTASQHGNYTEAAITQAVDTTKKAETLKHFLASCGYEQQMTVRMAKETEGVTYYQDYEISLIRSLHLSDLLLESEGNELYFVNTEGTVVRFDSEVQDCYVGVSKEAQSITIKGEFVNEKNTTDICGGYSIEVQGQSYSTLEGIDVPLTEEENQTIEVTVKHVNVNSIPMTYRIHVEKQDTVAVQFVTTPADAIVYVVHQQTNARVYPNEEGKYLLLPSNKYTYTVTCKGYVAKQVTGYSAPGQDGRVTVSLKKAQANTTIDSSIKAQWSSFRDTPDNNCVTDVKTPIESEEASLYWATKLGIGYGSKATGCPIIVDGYIYTYAGKTLYKIDTVNGEIVATGEMVESSSFAINPPTYAEGMIFIGLQDGRIQAFNAATLESLWVFQDEIGGQPNCPITYYNGYIYTGFWKGENQKANYVCVSVTDEDPAQQTEKKLPSWTYTSMGGFYWAGAYVCDDYMLIGTDDGESGCATGYSHVISLDILSGIVKDDVQLPFVGDVRSSMTLYDGKFYFTSKGGYFYEITVGAEGAIEEENLRYIKLENGSVSASNPAMSTSSPVIYNGRAYVGVSGISQFGAYQGHNITVLDLKSWKIAYSVPTQGYPQTSGLLTTAYEEEKGTTYIYFFDNYAPGKLRVIEDKPGQTQMSTYTEESYKYAGQDKTSKVGKVLFTPDGTHAQYALCSPIVDEYGTIYFKNDSAYLMAVGSTVEKIEVTQKPDKTRYLVGETFDATGMKVVATYTNGMTRDVSEYVTFSKEPLTVDDDDFAIQFKYVMYQNKDGEAGVDCEKPVTSVRITVQNLVPVSAKKATFDKDGNIAYWKDTKTGKLYADARGNQEITLKDTLIQKVSTAELSATAYTYNGKEQKPTVVVKDSAGTTLKEGNAYTVAYAKGRIDAGNYIVTVTLTGNYSGTKTLQYEIKAAKATVKLSDIKYTYNGKTKTPGVEVKGINGTILKENTDYTLTYAKGRKNVGKYAVTVTMKGNYSGTQTLYFQIKAAKATAKLSATTYTYNGKVKTPKVVVKNSAGTKLKKGTDYTVTYAKGRKNVGRYSVKITYKGNYSGSKTLYFYINPAGTKLSKVTAGKKKLTVTWKKNTKQVTGYQIQYSTSKKFKNAKTVTVKKNTTVKKSITKLSGKKKYYVRIRTYKTVKIGKKSQNLYSAWSSTKSATTKK